MKKIIINFCLIFFCFSVAQAQRFNFDDLHAWGKKEHVFNDEAKKPSKVAAKDALVVGKKMMAGDRIWSPSKNHYAIMQSDGNLCVYTSSNTWVWCNGTQEKGSYLILQPDGNMCVYTSDKRWVWDTRTHTLAAKPMSLSIDDRGTLHLNDKAGNSVWKNR